MSFTGYKDTPKLQGMRRQLVAQLSERGISSQLVLEAIKKVPRHLFIDADFEAHAYQDKAFPIEAQQTISTPFTVALQTELLGIEKGAKILEIGTGSGYQAAILAETGAEVYSIERQEALYLKSRQILSALGYGNITLRYGDGSEGFPEQAPFDGIIVTAAAAEVPKALLSQLKLGGRLVIPVGKHSQVMTLFIRKSKEEFHKKTFGDFRFVPLLTGTCDMSI